jgi:Leucine Rich Repeat (LRR) protein
MALTRRQAKYGICVVLGIAVVAVLWTLVVLNHYRESWKALRAVELHDGRVIYEWQVDRDGRIVCSADEAVPSRSVFLLVLGRDPRLDLRRIWGVSFEGSRIQDAELQLLRSFPNLRSVDLRKTEITDQGLRNVANIKSIEFLSLQHTEIGDGAVPYLSQLPRLRNLDLRGSRITRNGVDQLREASTLKTILADYRTSGESGATPDFGRSSPN